MTAKNKPKQKLYGLFSRSGRLVFRVGRSSGLYSACIYFTEVAAKEARGPRETVKEIAVSWWLSAKRRATKKGDHL